MKNTKGFKFSSFINAEEAKVTDEYVTYRGNFVMEIVLPNALKADSFRKLDKYYFNFMKSHNGKDPERILVNRRQYHEYGVLLMSSVYGSNHKGYVFKGVPLVINENYVR